MDGLTPEHHGQLNKMDVPATTYEHLRQHYASNPLALEQIDIYDGASEYHQHIEHLRQGYLSNDQAAIDRQNQWFRQHYPHSHAEEVGQ